MKTKVLRACLRCAWHAFLPPFAEKWMTGRCHYQDDPTDRCSYIEHMRMNLRALKLLVTTPVEQLSDADRRFHKV